MTKPLLVMMGATLCACSSSMDMPSDGGMAMDMGAMDMGASDSTGETTTGTVAPTLNAVNKMMGVLHVQWMNNSTSCDSIEGERKTDTEPYKVVFTVPGTINNKMDMEATKDMTYTYRLRCKVGSVYSTYSNEMGQNPVK